MFKVVFMWGTKAMLWLVAREILWCSTLQYVYNTYMYIYDMVVWASTLQYVYNMYVFIYDLVVWTSTSQYIYNTYVFTYD